MIVGFGFEPAMGRGAMRAPGLTRAPGGPSITGGNDVQNNENVGQTVVATIVNEQGVLNVTLAALASRAMRRTAVAVLRQADPTAYQQYKAIKHPASGATDETRRAAYSFAMAMAIDLATKNYIRGV